MRTAVLLLMCACGWSADYQTLTFRDGSVKVGFLNESKGTLTLDDGSTIAIKIKEIIRREATTPPAKALKIPPLVESPKSGTDVPEASRSSPVQRAVYLDQLQQSMDDVVRARLTWLDLLRQSTGRTNNLSEPQARQLAAAEADLGRASQALRQAADQFTEAQFGQ